MTGSTPARLYQLRSKMATSPAEGKWAMYRWMYIWDFSRSVGVDRAMCLNTRGLVRSVIRLIVPPLPAESRPSNTTQTLAPVAFTHSCIATSSPCRIRISASYAFRFNAPDALVATSPSDDSDVGSFPAFFAFFDFLLTDSISCRLV